MRILSIAIAAALFGSVLAVDTASAAQRVGIEHQSAVEFIATKHKKHKKVHKKHKKHHKHHAKKPKTEKTDKKADDKKTDKKADDKKTK